MRSFSLVLLRRLLFRPSLQSCNPNSSSPHPSHSTPRLTLYDHLSNDTLSKLERILLHSLEHEPAKGVRHKAVDTVCDLANEGMKRGRPWHALQIVVFSIAAAAGAGEGHGQAPLDPGVPPSRYLREAAFRVFAGCPNLVVDLQTDAVLAVFQRGLQDAFSVEVRCLVGTRALILILCTTGSTCRVARICCVSHRSGRSAPTIPTSLPYARNSARTRSTHRPHYTHNDAFAHAFTRRRIAVVLLTLV